MPWEIIHFRESEKIIKKKGLLKDLAKTLDYINRLLYDRRHFRGPLRRALADKGWREEMDTLCFMDGRRYRYKGFRDGVGIESDLATYEGILCGIFRLQIGYDRGLLETGVLLVNGQRGENSRLGTSYELAKREVEDLFPTISMPVAVVLFDLGMPPILEEDDEDGEVIGDATVSNGAQA